MIALSHTHYSLGRSTVKIPDLVKTAKELGYTSVAITDYSSVAACAEFYKMCVKHEIKPILGTKLNISRYPVQEDWINSQSKTPSIKSVQETKVDLLTILAKNEAGWRDILKIVTKSNSEQCYDFKKSVPRLDIQSLLEMHELKEINMDNLLFISGGLDSSVYNNCRGNSDEEKSVTKNEIQHMMDVFGDNFIIGVEQSEDSKHVREFLKEEGITHYEITNTHYIDKPDAIDHRVLLCNDCGITLKEGTVHPELRQFFHSEDYDLPFPLKNSIPDEWFESYNILSEPKLPKFECPDGMLDADYLRQLCEKGYAKLNGKLHATDKTYKERIDYELSVINTYNLSSYFLIIRDIINWCRQRGWMTNVRGSAAGSLVAYLIGITYIDPIEFDLIFERFMNPGRMSKDKISLPDIDTDVPSEYREEVIDYIVKKYGHIRVARLATFARLQGRAAMKAVLRVNSVCSDLEMDALTRYIPDESTISDELAEMIEEDKSIIKWALEHVKEMKDFVSIQDGEIVGEYAEYFKQAIRLEGTFASMGKHAAAVIVCDEPIVNYAPLIQDASHSDLIVGVEMKSAEDMSLVKLDILGLELLSKLMYLNKLLMGEIGW